MTYMQDYYIYKASKSKSLRFIGKSGTYHSHLLGNLNGKMAQDTILFESDDEPADGPDPALAQAPRAAPGFRRTYAGGALGVIKRNESRMSMVEDDLNYLIFFLVNKEEDWLMKYYDMIGIFSMIDNNLSSDYHYIVLDCSQEPKRLQLYENDNEDDVNFDQLKEVPFRDGYFEVKKLDFCHAVVGQESQVGFALMLDHMLFERSVYEAVVIKLIGEAKCMRSIEDDVLCMNDLAEYHLTMELDYSQFIKVALNDYLGPCDYNKSSTDNMIQSLFYCKLRLGYHSLAKPIVYLDSTFIDKFKLVYSTNAQTIWIPRVKINYQNLYLILMSIIIMIIITVVTLIFIYCKNSLKKGGRDRHGLLAEMRQRKFLERHPKWLYDGDLSEIRETSEEYSKTTCVYFMEKEDSNGYFKKGSENSYEFLLKIKKDNYKDEI